jgi:flavin-dependent dehydrogenase
MVLARAGFRVALFEKEKHPRFHIGESILPRTAALLKELQIDEAVAKLPQVPKYGAEFCLGDGSPSLMFSFTNGLVPGAPIFNIERSVLDKCLIEEARLAGVEVFEETNVRSIDRLEQDNVELTTSAGKVSGRILMDCSGHGTIVARHLGTRRTFSEPELQKVAYFNHFDNVRRPDGIATGHPCIVMCEEGWFWLIGLNEKVTSVGFVTRPSFVKTLNLPPDKLLQWAIARCPAVRERMKNASGPNTNRVLSDFSYKCSPLAGPGYFLVGDAGSFLDPIFSTGVTLALVGGNEAGKHAIRVLRGEESPAAAQQEYSNFVEGSTGVLWRLIRGYYRHSFRELFMNGQGPLSVHRAVISVLAGQVFPRPVWALRWRLRFFALCVKVQEWVPLCPRRKPFSLCAESPVEQSQFGNVTAEVA